MRRTLLVIGMAMVFAGTSSFASASNLAPLGGSGEVFRANNQFHWFAYARPQARISSPPLSTRGRRTIIPQTS